MLVIGWGSLSPEESVKYVDSLDREEVLIGTDALVGVGCTKEGAAGNEIKGECGWRGI